MILKEVDECFTMITSVNMFCIIFDNFCQQIEKYEKDEENLRLGMSKTDYPFDFFFAKACAEREHLKELLDSEHQDDDSNSDAEDDGDEDEDDDAEECNEDADKGPEEECNEDVDKCPEDKVADLKSS